MKEKKFNSDLKKSYLEYISEGIRQNKRFSEIVKNVEKRFGFKCIEKTTIQRWVSALKSSKRDFVKKQLGSKWMEHWDALHPDSQDESNRAESTRRESVETPSGLTPVSEAIASEAGSTRAVEESPDIIEIKQEPAAGLLKLPIKPNQASLMHPDSTTGFSKRVPIGILSKVNLNGQSYFIIKWQGSFEDELVLADEFKYQYPMLAMAFFEAKLNEKYDFSSTYPCTQI